MFGWKRYKKKNLPVNKFIKIKSSLKVFADDNYMPRCQSYLCETEN